MARPIRQPGLYLRTALFVDALKSRTGLGFEATWKQVDESQYQKYGLKGPSLETVRDYFRLRRSPAVDPQQSETPPWLMACELEFPGSSYFFFHPIVDLLIGQLESSVKWQTRLQKIPAPWIEDLVAKGEQQRADEWKEFNRGLVAKRGRPSKIAPIDPLSFIHLSLMRLGDPEFSILFSRTGLAITHARSFGPIDQEILLLSEKKSLDSVAAKVGLALEAGEIGDMNRLHVARAAVRDDLPSLVHLEPCRRARDFLAALIESNCLRVPARRYKATLHHGFGLPATWRAKLRQP